MDRRTQSIIAGTIVLLGVGVVGLGFIEGESGVRYVEDIVDDPAAYMDGSYTLIGELQPVELPDPNGTRPNDQWDDELVHGERIVRDGQTIQVTYRLAAEQREGRVIHWTLTTEERPVDRSGPAEVVAQETWTSEGLLFQVDSFEEDRTVWAVFQGATEPLARKPSQMEGRLATDVPMGALVFQVDTLAQQCSSKFVPEELRDEYDQDGDGLTD